MIMFDRCEGRNLKIYYSDASGYLKTTLNKVTIMDGAAFFFWLEPSQKKRLKLD